MLTKIKDWIPGRYADRARKVLCEIRPAGEAERAVVVRQEVVRRTLVCKVGAGLQCVPPFNKCPVVLQLVGVDDSPLRRGGGRTKPKISTAHRHVGQRIGNGGNRGHSVANAVSSESDVLTAIGGSKFVGHLQRNYTNPTESISLRRSEERRVGKECGC